MKERDGMKAYKIMWRFDGFCFLMVSNIQFLVTSKIWEKPCYSIKLVYLSVAPVRYELCIPSTTEAGTPLIPYSMLTASIFLARRMLVATLDVSPSKHTTTTRRAWRYVISNAAVDVSPGLKRVSSSCHWASSTWASANGLLVFCVRELRGIFTAPGRCWAVKSRIGRRSMSVTLSFSWRRDSRFLLKELALSALWLFPGLEVPFRFSWKSGPYRIAKVSTMEISQSST